MDDIQSWWEVPSIAHFCSLFCAAFNLLDFNIEELEEALLTDGADDTGSCLLQELMVRLLAGCLGHSPNNTDISPFNYQMFLRRLFREKCQELNRENPFNTDIDFQFLPLRTKVEILYTLCDFRLDADDVQEALKNLESHSLRVEPLGHDENMSAYWYFYGTRLYREDLPTPVKVKSKRKKLKQEKIKKKRGRPSLKQKAAEARQAAQDEDDSDAGGPKSGPSSVWQAICFTKEDWENLAAQLKDSSIEEERALYRKLTEDFLPEIPRLFAEKERLQRKRMMEFAPRRQSSRIEKLKTQREEEEKVLAREEEDKRVKDRKERDRRERQEQEENWRERMLNRQRFGTRASSRSHSWSSHSNSCNEEDPDPAEVAAAKPVGRQTNNSLASATGKIIIQASRQKLRSSQVFKPSKEDIRTGLYKVLEKLKNHKDSFPFRREVSEEEAPGYYSLISRPMNLNRMGDKLDDGRYTSIEQFRADFMRIVDNCRTYNGEDSKVTGLAQVLLNVFEQSVQRYLGSGLSSDEEIAVEFPPVRRRKKRHSQKDDDGDDEETIEDDENCDKNNSNNEKDNDSLRSRRGHKTNHRKRKERDRHREGKPSSRTAENNHEFSDERFSDLDEEDTRGSTSHKSRREERSRRVSSRRKNKKRTEEPDDWEEEERQERKREEQDRVWSQLLEGRPSMETKKGDEFDFDLDDAGWEGLKKGLQEWKREKRGQKESKRENATKLRRMSQEEEDRWFKEKAMIHEKWNVDRGGLKESSDSDRNRERSREREHWKKCQKDGSDESEVKGNRRDDKQSSKRGAGNGSKKPGGSTKTVDSQALSLATEQTLKDINKWLDDTPKLSEFSSPSNSPSNAVDDSDQTSSCVGGDSRRPLKGDRPHDPKRRLHSGGISRSDNSRSDPSAKSKSSSLGGSGSLSQLALQRRREAQRTTGRLQPGKSKGNLISTVQGSKSDPDTTKAIGKESKSSGEWGKSSGPKLSLGTVLTSGFGVGVGLVPRHNFGGSTPESQDSKDDIPDSPTFIIKDDNDSFKFEESADGADISEPLKPDNVHVTDKEMEENDDESKDSKPLKEDVKEEKKSKEKPNPTPNLSAWFKAFGAPKAQPAVRRKPELSATLDVRPSSPSLAATDSSNADLPLSRDFGDDIPCLERTTPAPRQRRTSTGSSISERSFSLDPNDGSSPSYPGPYPSPVAYPSPLHRSPDRPPPAYPTPLESSISVGFYQDTALSKTSPEENRPPSPYTQPPPSPYIRPLMSPYTQTPYHPLSYQPYSPAPYSPSLYSPMPYSPALDVNNKSVAPRTPAEVRHDVERSPSPLPPRSPMPARSPEPRASVDPRSPIERLQMESHSPLHDRSPSRLQIDIRSPMDTRSPHPEQSPDARSPRLQIDSRSPMHAGSPMDAESPRLHIDPRSPLDAKSPLDARSPIHSASPIVDSRSPLHVGSPMDSRSPIDSRLQIDSPIHSNSPVDSRSPVDNRLQIDSGSPIDSRSPKDPRLQMDTGSPMATHSPSSPADQMHKLIQTHHMGPGMQPSPSSSSDPMRSQMYPQYHTSAGMLPYSDQPPKAPVPQYPAIGNEYRPDMSSAANQPYGSRGYPYLPPPLSNEQSVHNQYKVGASAAEKALAEQYLATMTRTSQEAYANRPYRLPTDPSARQEHETGATKSTSGNHSGHDQPYRVPGRENSQPPVSQEMSKYAMEQYQSSLMQGPVGSDSSVRQYYQMQQQQQQIKEQQPYHQQYQDPQMHQQMTQQQYQQQLEEQKTLPKKKRPTKKQLKQQQEQMELEAQMKQQQQVQQLQQQVQQTHQQMQQHQQELQHEQQRHQAQLQQQHMQQHIQHQQMEQQQGQHQQYNQLQQLQEQRQLHHEAQLQHQQQYQQHLQQQLLQQQSQQVPRSRTPVSSFPVKKRHYAEPVSQSSGPFTPLGGDANLGKGAFSQPVRNSAPVPASYSTPAIAHAGNAGGSGDTVTQRPQFLQAPSSLGVPRSPFAPVSSGTELTNPRDMFSSAVRNDLAMSRSPFTPVTSSSESTRSPRGTYPSSDTNPRSPFTPSAVGSSIGLPHASLGHMMDVYQHSPLYNPNNPLFARPASAFRDSQQPGTVASASSSTSVAANQGFNTQANEAANKASLPKPTKGRRKAKADGGPPESCSPPAPHPPASQTPAGASAASTAFQQYSSKGVLPTSSFNFNPSSLYPDKDAFPNYLDEYRAGQAGFYGHSRPTTESTDKSVHNVANVAPVAAVSAVQSASASFPFLGHQTTRPPSYPLAQPFPYDPATYQQYLLHQGLYSSGYHHALGLRQPYDSIQRPHWL